MLKTFHPLHQPVENWRALMSGPLCVAVMAKPTATPAIWALWDTHVLIVLKTHTIAPPPQASCNSNTTITVVSRGECKPGGF